jgi:hypothetical protein
MAIQPRSSTAAGFRSTLAARDDAAAIIEKVKTFEEFDADGDPYGEHDFGSFDLGSDEIFWKIDAYNTNPKWGSPDPTAPAVTTRMLTIMLAEEIERRDAVRSYPRDTGNR